jgi:hypothetical protein
MLTPSRNPLVTLGIGISPQLPASFHSISNVRRGAFSVFFVVATALRRRVDRRRVRNLPALDTWEKN